MAVLRGRDPFLDEGVPLVAVRALPEQFGAAVAAPDADVRVEIEDRVPGELHVAVNQSPFQIELGERLPDRLVDGQGVRILHERVEEQVQALADAALARQVA